MRKIWRMWLLAALFCMLLGVAAAEDFAGERHVTSSPLRAAVAVAGTAVEVQGTQIDGETWLFLPSFTSLDTLTFTWETQAVTLGEVWETDMEGVLAGQIVSGGEVLTEICIMQSAHLRTLFLFSDDPVHQGREYIDNCERHENFTTATMALVNAQGGVDHAQPVRHLRGRGNGTWLGEKRSYQMTLDWAADLLNLGMRSEQRDTWVLLAEAKDGTLLHNKVSLDLALELGLADTSHSEHVDLYYDGEYRGVYLLAEKVEIGEGRLDERDYEEILEEINRHAGINDLDLLPAAESLNDYGMRFSCIEGMAEANQPGAGAYLLEMEQPQTLSDRSWFEMTNGTLIGVKNPDNASQTMMRFISNRLEEAWQTLLDGGVNRRTGRTLADDFNVDAFARIALLNELAYNVDGYSWSSSYFVLPAGQTRFEPGVIWDFDLAWRYALTGNNANADGLVVSQWLSAFYGADGFVQRMREIYTQELLPLVETILLGDRQGVWLSPLNRYIEHLTPAARMNEMRWTVVPTPDPRMVYAPTWDEETEMFREFITLRSWWLQRTLALEANAGQVDLIGQAEYLNMQETFSITAWPWDDVSVLDMTVEQVSEATEEEYALWRVQAVLEAPQTLKTLTFNDTEIDFVHQQDGAVALDVLVQDLSYRPVYYDGDDYGLVYNYDAYIRNHPEVLEICGDDKEAVLEYFYLEGTTAAHKGNAFFDPAIVLYYNHELYSTLGESWDLYYLDFIDFGVEEGWMEKVGTLFRPPVYPQQP